MAIIATAIVIFAGLWIIWTGLGMLVEPQRMRELLAMMASSQQINLTEQSLRALVGIAMIVQANAAKLPVFFTIGGGFLVVTALALALIPLRWHASYAIWWADTLKPWAVRLLSAPAVLLGGLFIWAAI